MNGNDEDDGPLADPERTIYSPGTGLPPQQPDPPAKPDPSVSAPVSPPMPAGGAQRIKVGDILNHLYQVRRSIARGGMGEVFEGENVNYSEERVAIKVILPHLAADPAVQGMFFKEARTLTRLSHPALVQYRTMAQEPQLGVFYIVTEFVDGPNLSDQLKQIEATPQQLAGLIRRLAEGLGVAHSMGAIHRDISPDNILLEGGALERAKIIDFGIAKDLDPSSGTIVGDGFAGKLNYVAPEQLGEYGRSVGPWSDIYSLGLTILAVARGRDVDMGGTIVDAVDKRRAGPDLSPVPKTLLPLFERMLAADPAKRMRSMDEVVQWLVLWGQGKAVAESKGSRGAGRTPAGQPFWHDLAARIKIPPQLKEPRGVMMAGGGALGLLVLVAVVISFSGGSSDAPDEAARLDSDPVSRSVQPVDKAAAARTVLSSGLTKIPCSWLDVESIDGGGAAPVAVALKGVSGRSTEAMAQVEAMMKTAGITGVSVNYTDIAPVPASFCGPLEAFGQVRSVGVGHLSVPLPKFEMAPLDGSWGGNAGVLAAKAVIEIDMTGLTKDDLAVMGVADNGQMDLISVGFKDMKPPVLEDLGNQRYRLNLPTTNSGWSGIVLIVGRGPFDKALLTRPAEAMGPDWAQKFLAEARQRGWKSEMAWYQSVNEQPDAAPAR